MRDKNPAELKSAAPSADSCTDAPSSAAVTNALFCPKIDPTIPANAEFNDAEISSTLTLNLLNAALAGPFT